MPFLFFQDVRSYSTSAGDSHKKRTPATAALSHALSSLPETPALFTKLPCSLLAQMPRLC